LAISGNCIAQSPTNIDNKVLLSKEYSFYGMVHTEGWGFGGRFGSNRTYYNKRMLEFELLNMKHPKEIKTINPYFTGNKNYIYGKTHYNYFLRAGLGNMKTLNEKPYWGGVQIRYFYSYGITVDFNLPVYLYILNYSSSPGEYIVSEERFDPEEHNHSNIYGRGSWTSGFKYFGVNPGLYFKAGLNFEYGIEDKYVKAIEAGFIADGFLKEVPMMAFDNDKRLFLSFYLSLHFGRRSN
jgi:hypothetical protein